MKSWPANVHSTSLIPGKHSVDINGHARSRTGSNQNSSIWAYVFFTTSQTLMMTVIHVLSDGSVLLAMAFHFSNNMSAFMQNIPPSFNERLEIGVHIAVGAFCVTFLLTQT